MSARQVVVVGNVTIDDVVHPDGTLWPGQLGGNAVYASVGSRLTGAPTAIVSRHGTDVPGGLLADLAALGVSLDALHAYDGPTTRAWLIYDDEGRRRFVPRTTGPTVRDVDLPSLQGFPGDPALRAAVVRHRVAAGRGTRRRAGRDDRAGQPRELG